MDSDPWLEPLLPLVRARMGSGSVLELGCGRGVDTSMLAKAGCHVVGIDLSASAIAKAKARVPTCEFHCQDIRADFPSSGAGVGVVVASLSLHYFTRDETLVLVQRIRAALSPDGVMLCRLNSINDYHYGASGHPEIETNYYLVNGEPKRFFSKAAVMELFASGWRILKIEEKIIHRYDHPKSIWEVVLERVD
jgi:SAM-dependent methyltransferase